MSEDTDLSKGRDRRLLKSNWRLLEHMATDQRAGVPVPDPQKPVPDGSRLVDLPAPDGAATNGITLFDAVRNRKSRRSYTGDSLTPAEMSFLLYAVQGVRKLAAKWSFRTVPSAGARHPLETYLHVSRVEGLGRGMYRYLPREHRLLFLFDHDGLEGELDAALLEQRWNSAATFVWTAVPYRTEWRYSIVSHKLIALDAGHACQNLYLACEAIGCGTCGIGAYDQEGMDQVLRVDGEDEFTVYAAPVGRVRE